MVLLELFLSFVKIGFCSFGGLSMIPVISEETVSKGWITAQQLSDIVGIAEMTPGSLGVNCATFVGLQVANVGGALIATLGVMMPSLTVCMAAAHFIMKFKDNKYLQNAMWGIRPVCLGMIISVIFPLAQTNYIFMNIVSWQAIVIGCAVLVLIMKFKWRIPAVIGFSALCGILFVR